MPPITAMACQQTAHALWLYDGQGKCLFKREWHRPRNLLRHDPGEDEKFIFGLVFGLDSLAPQLAPTSAADMEHGFVAFTTDTYALHHMATATGLHWILMTSPDVRGVARLLHTLYREAYVPCVALNVLHTPGDAIANDAFISEVDKLVALQAGTSGTA